MTPVRGSNHTKGPEFESPGPAPEINHPGTQLRTTEKTYIGTWCNGSTAYYAFPVNGNSQQPILCYGSRKRRFESSRPDQRLSSSRYSFNENRASFAVMQGWLAFYILRTYICAKPYIAMKDEKNLSDRLNDRARTIPIHRKDQEEEPMNTCYPSIDPCKECDDTSCPSNPNYMDEDGAVKSPYEKMSPSEQSELKELIEKSRTVLGKTVNTIKDKWEDFQKNNNLRDEDLINRWKDYKSKVEAWIEEHKKFPTTIAKAMLLDEYDEEKSNEVNLPWNERTFKSIVDKMFDTYQRKNADYGSSFSKLFDKFGMKSALIRLTDKYNRLEALTLSGEDPKVNDESIEDTLMDMANYAILTIIELRARKEAGVSNSKPEK